MTSTPDTLLHGMAYLRTQSLVILLLILCIESLCEFTACDHIILQIDLTVKFCDVLSDIYVILHICIQVLITGTDKSTEISTVSQISSTHIAKLVNVP